VQETNATCVLGWSGGKQPCVLGGLRHSKDSRVLDAETDGLQFLGGGHAAAQSRRPLVKSSSPIWLPLSTPNSKFGHQSNLKCASCSAAPWITTHSALTTQQQQIRTTHTGHSRAWHASSSNNSPANSAAPGPTQQTPAGLQQDGSERQHTHTHVHILLQRTHPQAEDRRSGAHTHARLDCKQQCLQAPNMRGGACVKAPIERREALTGSDTPVSASIAASKTPDLTGQQNPAKKASLSKEALPPLAYGITEAHTPLLQGDSSLFSQTKHTQRHALGIQLEGQCSS
jgi:hypothetical protein